MLRLALLTSLLIAPSIRGELLWPLQQAESERALSSSFCEDRGSHLHGGVDMSTGGRVGVPVLAAADGAVVRIKVEYRGLGRAIYVQHAGGLMSVSGHLAGFAEPMRSWVDGLIARKGPYPGDLFPDEPFPVKAGEIIAWSGKTGGGPPHLHFETRRDGGNRPVDPWAEGLPCIDSTPPVIDALALLASQLPDAVERLVELPTSERIPLAGSELLRVRVADHFAAGTGFVRRLRLSYQGIELYRWDAGSYTYGVTMLAGHAFSRAVPKGADPRARGSWIWLLRWPGGGLPFVTGREAFDARPLGEPGDEGLLVIEAVDGCGNLALQRVPVLLVAGKKESTKPEASSAAPTLAAGGTLVPGEAFGLEREGIRLALPAHAVGFAAELRLGPATAVGEPPAGLRRVAGPISLEPAWLPLAKKARVSFPLPSGVAERAFGVYRWDPAGRRWQFWGDDARTATEVGTSTDRLGDFALLEDRSPPRVLTLTRRRVKGLPWRADADELVVSYAETGEGVAWNGLRFRPTGSDEEWIADHDPDLDEGAFSLPLALVGDRVTGTLVLEDLAGNRVERPVDSSP